jgi:hypothetical protein
MPSAMSTHVVEPSYPSGWGQHAAASELCEMLSTLGLAQHRVAHLFGVGPRSVRRWQYGDRRVPCGVGIVLRLWPRGSDGCPSRAGRHPYPGPDKRQRQTWATRSPPRRAGAGTVRLGAHQGSHPRRPRPDYRRKGSARSPQRFAAGRAAILGSLIFTSAAVRLPRGPTANSTAPWPTWHR